MTDETGPKDESQNEQGTDEQRSDNKYASTSDPAPASEDPGGGQTQGSGGGEPAPPPGGGGN